MNWRQMKNKAADIKHFAMKVKLSEQQTAVQQQSGNFLAGQIVDKGKRKEPGDNENRKTSNPRVSTACRARFGWLQEK
jgi:hypothetical protein